MTGELATEGQVLASLRALVEGQSIRDAAAMMAMSPAYLHAVLHGKKPVGRRIPAYFGLRPVTLYAPVRLRRRQ